MRLSVKYTSLLFIAYFSLIINGFSATIRGIVSEKQNGEPIAGAIVMLDSTAFVAITGLDGTYTLNNIPVGEHLLKIKYPSYKTFSQSVSVKDDQPIVINAGLESAVSQLSEVLITAKLKTGSDEEARSIEKNSDPLMNIISARTIELLPDVTVANVMQRVSGVQVQRNANGEARYAAIRGMDKRYNYTTVDGVKIASPDDKGRYVPLDVFPVELVDRVEVIKSLTPSMEGDAIGGVTNLVMKQAPDHFVISATAATGYNENNFDASFSKFNQKATFDNDPAKLYGTAYQAKTSDFPLGSSNISHVQAPPNGLYSLSIGDRFLKHKQLGVMFAGSYQNTFKQTDNIFFKPAAQPGANNLAQFDDIEIRKYATQEARTGLHTNIDYIINDKNTIDLYGLFLNLNQLEDRNISDTTIGPNRAGPGQGVVSYKDRTAMRVDKIASFKLKGKHVLANKLILDWTGAFNKSTRDVPDMTEISSGQNFILDTNHVIQKSTLVYKGWSKSWEKTSDQDFQGFVNLTYTPSIFGKDVEFKAGGMDKNKDRYNYYNSYSASPVNTSLPFTTLAAVADSPMLISNSLGDPGNALTYRVHENIYAAYGQFKIFFFDNKLEALGGVRVEHTHLYDSLSENSSAINAVAGTYDYTDVLPSLHLKYALTETQNLRLSYYESINRPGFFELVNYSFAGEEFTEIGNPYLNHSIAQNFDARYELFPKHKGKEQLLAGIFYKNIDDPIEYLITRLDKPSAQYLQPENVPGGNAINYGAELAYTKYFHYFGITGNYTYTHSAIKVNDLQANAAGLLVNATETRPLQGQAAHVGNLSVFYKNPVLGLDAQVSAQYTGRHIALLSEYVGLDYYQKGTTFLDFSCEKRIVNRLSVYAKVHNLLNTPTILELNASNSQFTNSKNPALELPYQNLADGKTLVEKSLYGRNYLVGLRYKFN
jgi:outer membrane cobalamin receptor